MIFCDFSLFWKFFKLVMLCGVFDGRVSFEELFKFRLFDFIFVLCYVEECCCFIEFVILEVIELMFVVCR